MGHKSRKDKKEPLFIPGSAFPRRLLVPHCGGPRHRNMPRHIERRCLRGPVLGSGLGQTARPQWVV
eukprot:3338061-Amphidinium_carterae.1